MVAQKVINLFGGPGVGKSTMSAAMFAFLKQHGYSAELVVEFAKDLVYQNASAEEWDQRWVFANQLFRMSRLQGKVDWIVTDSPLLLSNAYGHEETPLFKLWVEENFNAYENYNFWIPRRVPYDPAGRNQPNIEEAMRWDAKIANLLVGSHTYTRLEPNADVAKVLGDLIEGYELLATSTVCAGVVEVNLGATAAADLPVPGTPTSAASDVPDSPGTSAVQAWKKGTVPIASSKFTGHGFIH